MTLTWDQIPDPVKTDMAMDFKSGMSICVVAMKHGVNDKDVEEAVRWVMKRQK